MITEWLDIERILETPLISQKQQKRQAIMDLLMMHKKRRSSEQIIMDSKSLFLCTILFIFQVQYRIKTGLHQIGTLSLESSGAKPLQFQRLF